MPFTSHEVQSQHFVSYQTPDGLAITLTGIVIVTAQGTGAQWERGRVSFRVHLPIPTGRSMRFIHWAPFVTLNSIANDNAATNAGWAVDHFEIRTPEAENLIPRSSVVSRQHRGHGAPRRPEQA